MLLVFRVDAAGASPPANLRMASSGATEEQLPQVQQLLRPSVEQHQQRRGVQQLDFSSRQHMPPYINIDPGFIQLDLNA